MGQYYTAIIEGKNKKLYGIEELGFSKLMEHSYIGNDFPEFVAQLLDHTRVVWMGSYAKECIQPGTQDHFTSCSGDIRMFTDDIHKTLSNLSKWRLTPPDAHSVINMDDMFGWVHAGSFPVMPRIRKVLDKGYLVNEDRKEYIAMSRYCKNNPDKKYHLIVSPLPLLTAIGNNLGSGDYDGMNQEYVGLWAWNALTYSTTNPREEYTDKTDEYVFKE